MRDRTTVRMAAVAPLLAEVFAEARRAPKPVGRKSASTSACWANRSSRRSCACPGCRQRRMLLKRCEHGLAIVTVPTMGYRPNSR